MNKKGDRHEGIFAKILTLQSAQNSPPADLHGGAPKGRGGFGCGLSALPVRVRTQTGAVADRSVFPTVLGQTVDPRALEES